MPALTPLYFGPYRLDGPTGPLWHHLKIEDLPPKVLAVLWLLASQAGRMVSKATLLDTVWAEGPRHLGLVAISLLLSVLVGIPLGVLVILYLIFH